MLGLIKFARLLKFHISGIDFNAFPLHLIYVGIESNTNLVQLYGIVRNKCLNNRTGNSNFQLYLERGAV